MLLEKKRKLKAKEILWRATVKGETKKITETIYKVVCKLVFFLK